MAAPEHEASWMSLDLWGDDGPGPRARPAGAERRPSVTFRDGPRDRSRSGSRSVRRPTTPLPLRLLASRAGVARGHRGEAERQPGTDALAPAQGERRSSKKGKKKRRSKKSSGRSRSRGRSTSSTPGPRNADGPSFDAVAYKQSGDGRGPPGPWDSPPAHACPSSAPATLVDPSNPSGAVLEEQDQRRPAHRLADFDANRDKSKNSHKPTLLTRKHKQHGKKPQRPKDGDDGEGSVTSHGSGTTTTSVFTTTCIKLKHGLKGYLNQKHPRGPKGKPKMTRTSSDFHSSAENLSVSEQGSARGAGSERSSSRGRRPRGHGFSRKRTTSTASTVTTCSHSGSPLRRLSPSDFCAGSPRAGTGSSDPEGGFNDSSRSLRDSSMPFIEEEEPSRMLSPSGSGEEGSKPSLPPSKSMPNLADVGEEDASCGPRSAYDGAGGTENLSLPLRNASVGPTQVVGLPWQDDASKGKLHGMYSGPVDGLFRPHGEGKLVLEGNSFLTFYGQWADGALVSPLLNDEEKRAQDEARSSDTPTDPDDVNGVVEDTGPVPSKSSKSKQRRSRPRYKLGDVARTPKDMVIHRSNHNAILSVSLLKEFDQAFLKRSNGLWTCCVLAERALQPAAASSARWYAEHELDDDSGVELEESMLFVINEDGATKIVKRRHWGKFVRCIQGQTVNVGE